MPKSKTGTNWRIFRCGTIIQSSYDLHKIPFHHILSEGLTYHEMIPFSRIFYDTWNYPTIRPDKMIQNQHSDTSTI